MKISLASKKDIKRLYEIECEVFGSDIMKMSLNSFYYHIKKQFLYKIQINKKIAGYILWLDRKNYLRLYSLAVSSEFRGLGLASKLLQYSIKNLQKKPMQLEVKKTNIKAIALYEKFDFKTIKLLINYYNNEDGILMRLER